MSNMSIVKIHPADTGSEQKLPLYLSKVTAGFPSPADDYLDKKLDLNEFLVRHPASTFFVKVQGDSMVGAGILSGSILVVDKSLEPKNGKIVIAIINGDFTVKRFKKSKGKTYLMAENPEFEPIEINESANLEIWGVVTHVVHSL